MFQLHPHTTALTDAGWQRVEKALQQELHAASCHVGRTLLASGTRITRAHADMAGLAWVQSRASGAPLP